MSFTSVRTLVNDKADNKLNSGTVYKASGIYLTTEKNPGKPQTNGRLKKIVEGGICTWSVQTTSIVLLFIPALKKHPWNVKQITIHFKTGNVRQLKHSLFQLCSGVKFFKLNKEVLVKVVCLLQNSEFRTQIFKCWA